jgi:predicted acetylornithine/succinylornithine family transaminase
MDTRQMFADHVMGTYMRSGPVFVKGKGSWLWDEDGKKYLDLFPGWGVGILGHAHPAVARAIAQQAKTLIHLPNNLYTPNQAMAAKELIEASFGEGKVFFCNSGAEAIEGSLKLSRAYGKAKNKTGIISMDKSFHGRTMGALSVTAQAKYQDPFRPLVGDVKSVPFNDIEALEKAVTDTTAAILLEPIQGEGGVNIADEEYLRKVRALRDEREIVLIFDEVQTGMGRTGKMFAFQYFGVEPDVIALSKGLGAGFPVGCFIAKPKFAEILKPGMHASTFGGSSLATAAVMATLDAIKDEKVLDNVNKKCSKLKERLSRLKKECSCVKDVRGVGLMWAIELDVPARPLYNAMMERGVIMNVTHETIMRILPALNISDRDFNHAFSIFEEELTKFNAALKRG